MKFILALHTETDWNESGRLQGQTDIPLNEFGKQRARELGDKIASGLGALGIAKIISSDLKRASETAQIIGERISVPIIFDRRLRECRFGSLEGLAKAELKERIPELNGSPTFTTKDTWHGSFHEYDFSKFGGENRDRVFVRHRACLEEILRTTRGQAIIIVGHGTGLNTLLAGLGVEQVLTRGDYYVFEYPRE